MAYSFSTNQTPGTGAVAMFNFKQTLVAAGWLVKSSSDGTTYNSTGDQITTGASGAGGLNNVNAWFRIQMPSVTSVTREFVFQRIGTSVLWRSKYSYSAGFTGGTPGATRVPSATDEAVVAGSGTDASPTGTTMFNTDGTYRFNCAAGGAAEGYVFWTAAFPINGGNVNHMMIWDVLLAGTYPAADIEPYVLGMYGTTTTLNQSDFSGINWSNIFFLTWWRKGFGDQSYINISGQQFAEGSGASNGQCITTQLGSNPWNGKDDLIPMPLMRRVSAGAGGYKGVLTNTKFMGTLRTTGDTLSISSTRDRIVLRPIAMAWDGSVPTV